MGVQRHDPVLGWVRAVPEPFWVRSWRSLFRWRPACYEHRITFGSVDEWTEHYLRCHGD